MFAIIAEPMLIETTACDSIRGVPAVQHRGSVLRLIFIHRASSPIELPFWSLVDEDES